MKIYGFENVLFINRESFKIIKAQGNHSICEFSATINPSDLNTYLQKIGDCIKVELDEYDNGKKSSYNKVIFNGIISNICTDVSFSETIINISSVSFSVFEDEERYTRIFQNPDKNFSDLANVQRLNLKKSEIRINEGLAERVVRNVVVQNQETNFEFLKNLSRKIGTRLWINDLDSECVNIVFASKLGKLDEKLSSNDIISYQKHRSREKNTIKIVAKNYIEIGRIINVLDDPKDYLVIRLSVYYLNKVLVYSYELTDIIENKETNRTQFSLEKSVVFKAKVKNVTDPDNMGRIQVEFVETGFDGVVDMDKECPIWLEYRTPYTGINSGIVFIPDVDDYVDVFYCNEQCYAYSSYRQNCLNEECQSISDKYIGNNTSQRIIWKKDSLELLSHDNKIILNKDGIRMIVGESILSITEKEIQIQQSSNKLKIDGNNIVADADNIIQLKGSSEVLIKADKKVFIGGGNNIDLKSDSRIDIEADNKLCIESRNVNLKATKVNMN